jgi:hypothetical protein
MNDDETLAALRNSLTGVKESLTDVHLNRSADAIRARARGRVVRRGLAGAGAAGVAPGVSLALTAGGSGTGATRSVHVNLDAWSVNTLPDGLVYVDVRELVQPTLLRQTLAQAGVPAIITFGEFCTDPSGYYTSNLGQILGKTAQGGEPRLTIKPSGIPAGSELSIGIVSVAVDKPGGPGHALDTAFGVVKEGSRLTCGRFPAQQEPRGKGPGKPIPSSGAGPRGSRAAKGAGLLVRGRRPGAAGP